MYQFSRAIYRELAPLIDKDQRAGELESHRHVLGACEAAIERLANDRHYFARPARTLFQDIRSYFPVATLPQVYRIVANYLAVTDAFLARMPRNGYDANGNPLQCRAMTRKGSACQRMPLPHNGYCPSHQHLADTEDAEILAA
jgi:hypothetical protein